MSEDAPEVVAFVALKGGTGKTTSTIFLSEAVAAAGLRPAILDTDPQGSAAKWARFAESIGTPLSAQVRQVGDGLTVAEAAAKVRADTGCDVLLIDTPPGAGDRDISLAAARCSQGVIVPSRSSEVELYELRPSLTLARQANVPAVVLHTAVDLRMKEDKAFRDVLEEKGIMYFRNAIPYNAVLKRAGGKRPDPNKLYGYGWVWREIADPDDLDGGEL